MSKKRINRLWAENGITMSFQTYRGINAICERLDEKWIVREIKHQPFSILNKRDISHYERTGHTIEEAFVAILGFANYIDAFSKNVSA